MYRIGEFSKLGKTTIKTLRFYEKQGLLKPARIDEYTGYRYYQGGQLIDLARIVALRQTGFSIEEIKDFTRGKDLFSFLDEKRAELEKAQSDVAEKLRRINYLSERKIMEKEVVVKKIPEYTVYYADGVLEKYSDAGAFILQSAEKCLALNPDIKCVKPDYGFMTYLDGEYKEKNVKVRYCQAVERAGTESEDIKFETLKPITAACIYHKGSYETLSESYGFLLSWIEENGYAADGYIRETYIDGVWNKDDPKDYLTEIQVPVKKR